MAAIPCDHGSPVNGHRPPGGPLGASSCVMASARMCWAVLLSIGRRKACSRTFFSFGAAVRS